MVVAVAVVVVVAAAVVVGVGAEEEVHDGGSTLRHLGRLGNLYCHH